MFRGLLEGWHLPIIILVVVLLFGSSKIPDLARSLGRSVNEFKKGREEGKKEDNTPAPTDTTKKPQ